jgi:hypothetical protein
VKTKKLKVANGITNGSRPHQDGNLRQDERTSTLTGAIEIIRISHYFFNTLHGFFAADLPEGDDSGAKGLFWVFFGRSTSAE